MGYRVFQQKSATTGSSLSNFCSRKFSRVHSAKQRKAIRLNGRNESQTGITNTFNNLDLNQLQLKPNNSQQSLNGHRTFQLQSDTTSQQLPTDRLRLFSGTANLPLAQEVACYLGMQLSPITIKQFADGEFYIRIDESIRGCDVFIIQATSPPVNDNLCELMVMIDACKRASPRSITAVIPYYGYARADRKVHGRESIAAKLTANLVTEAGADRVLAIDLHSGQCVGYFDIPVDHVYGEKILVDFIAQQSKAQGDLVVVSPDVGGVARARAFAKKLDDANLVIVDKRRSGHNEAEVMNLIGDVEGKIAVLVDDMIDTAGTITNAGKVLRERGAKKVFACATHAVFSPPAKERLSSGVFEAVVVTNTINLSDDKRFPGLVILSVASLLGESIWRVFNASALKGLR
eukprot:TRINITY_DN58663_c0_g1_i1.p1 TRINITY_DN58663_c0_g1~~TRINITY_DN58663_c0_g1_i1.p1  ORF type:complete len:421 (+),score=65.54 TRINITY_DN58663_c0_g1_i1:54-1265(+)